MNFNRLFARVILIAAGLFASIISVLVVTFRGTDKPETWTVIAASLAVLTSVISTWSSRRLLELQEDAQQPNPTPNFDLKSKFGAALFTVSNTGKLTAYNISLEWDVALKDMEDRIIGFVKTTRPGIAQLLPGESLSQWINVHADFIQNLPDQDYRGRIEYEDANGRKYKKTFRLDGHQYDGTPAHDGEWTKTQYELQKIPRELQAIRQILERKKLEE